MPFLRGRIWMSFVTRDLEEVGPRFPVEFEEEGGRFKYAEVPVELIGRTVSGRIAVYANETGGEPLFWMDIPCPHPGDVFQLPTLSISAG